MFRNQLQGSFSLITEVANDTTDEEWTAQAFEGQNPAGFTLWHCVRCLDWGVNCAISGVPEVASEPRWRGMLASTAWFGYDVTLETARQVAASVKRAKLMDYAGEVQSSMMSWLDSQTENNLDSVPDLRNNYQSNGMYLSTARLEAWIEEDRGTPVWQFIAGTCVGHIRRHMGEVQALLQVMRSRITT